MKHYTQPQTHESHINSLEDELKSLFDAPEYPCAGAKAAFAGKTYRYGTFHELGTRKSARGLAQGLKKYVREVERSGSIYMSYLAIFERGPRSEKGFEDALWQQLTYLHNLDSEPWNEHVSSNPAQNNFSFSFHNHAFFIVGMHPDASRKSRKTPWPILVFNLHGQFQKLREQGKFEPMKKAIRKKEIDLQGSINPMLADFGDGKEAPQYSGRKVQANWKCPFHHSS